MRSFKPFALVGIGAIAAATESHACNSPTSPVTKTMYITVPASPVTETIYAASPVSPSIEGGADTTIHPTLTVTNSVASTQVIQIVQAPSLPGPYSFTVDNETTIWMGGQTPPASVSLVTSTSYITLQPVSTPVSEDASGTTHKSTRTVTHTYTKTLTESNSLVQAFAKVYTGYGSAGWNRSMTTFLKLKVMSTEASIAAPSVYQADIPVAVSAHQEGLIAWPTSFTNSTRLIRPRQVGDVIVATIDDLAVSWTNSYGGSTPTVSEAEPTFVPVTATAPSFGGDISSTAIPSSSPTLLSLSAPGTPTTTVGIYPWDLNPSSIDSVTPISASRQPGINPMPSVSTSSMASLLSAIFTAQPASSTTFARTLVTRTSAGNISGAMYSSASTVSVSAATTVGSSCGNVLAQFTVDFDDLPSFSTGPGDTDIPPIFNPYRKLYWEGHYGYVPPPTDPFPPHSPPQLAVYREGGLYLNSSTDAGLELMGGVGSGPRANYSAYWFDAYSAWLGCANGGADHCTITIKGYTNGNNNNATVSHIVTQPPCPGLENCSLALIIATVDEQAVNWYMDDLELSWSNNSCAAQLVRSSSE